MNSEYLFDKDLIVSHWEKFADWDYSHLVEDPDPQRNYRYWTQLRTDPDREVRDFIPVVIDFNHIHRYDAQFAQVILEYPTRAVGLGDFVFSTIHEEFFGELCDRHKAARVRFFNMDLSEGTISISDFRIADLDEFVETKVIIRRISDIKPFVIKAAWRCTNCMNLFHERQFNEDELKVPNECSEEEGGCGRAYNGIDVDFEYVSEQSWKRDSQKIQLQELPEGKMDGTPRRTTAWVYDDLCDSVVLGGRYTIVGILKSKLKRRNQRTYRRVEETYVEIINIIPERDTALDVAISPEDERFLLSLKDIGSPVEILSTAIAPTLTGIEQIKIGATLQLLGGVRKEFDDGTAIRGDIHIGYIQDPGTGKTILLKWCEGLIPRTMYVSAEWATAAGLGAAMVQDSWNEGRWVAEAGALVCCDQGGAFVDELDKLNKEHYSSLNSSMELQEIHLAKAGQQITFYSRCFVAAGMNPKEGNFNLQKTPIVSQIGVRPDILNRFDVLFVIPDIPEKNMDTERASHLLSVHMGYHERDEKVNEHPLYTRELLMKYFSYCRQNFEPKLTKETCDMLLDRYLGIRLTYTPGGPVPINIRTLVSLIRLSEASARGDMEHHVRPEDVERAFALYQHSQEYLYMDEFGALDISILTSGKSKAQRDRLKEILYIMNELKPNFEGGIPDDVLMDVLITRTRATEDIIRADLETLRIDGSVWEGKKGMWDVIKILWD